MEIDLNDVMAFTRVADEGSFTRAAARLGQPKSSVSHRVGRLEQALGVRLLERTTRKLRLTAAGARYHAQARSLLMQFDEASAALVQYHTQPQGLLRVTASVVLGQMLLPALLADYSVQYPQVQLFVELTNRRVDQLEEGFDVAIRAGVLPDSTLVCRRLGHARAALYAAPAYLARHGAPVTPAELAGHRLLETAPRTAGEHWLLRQPGHADVLVAARFGIAANDPLMLREVAASGAGIASLPTFIAGPALAEGRLRPVLEGWTTKALDVHVLFPSHKGMAPAVRAFVDLAVERLGRSLEDDLISL